VIELARWIAGYYLAPIGDVFRAMLRAVVELPFTTSCCPDASGKEMIEKRMQGDSNLWRPRSFRTRRHNCWCFSHARNRPWYSALLTGLASTVTFF